MRTLMAPTRFPDPANMNRTSNDEWLRWMRHEMFDLVDAIDEEKRARQDDNDPFNGTAGGVFQPPPENNQGESSGPSTANPAVLNDREEGNNLPNRTTRGTPQPLSGNDQNIPIQNTDQGETVPQNDGHQSETPERVVPVQTIRPTPQVQRETRRNAMETTQPQPIRAHETMPANTHVQTPLIHPTTAGEETTGAAYQEPRRGRTVEDEISSQEGVRRIADTRRFAIANQEQRDRRGGPFNTYQTGYGQRQYEERRPPTGARRQISYDRLNVGAMTQEWPDRPRALNNTSYMQFPQQNRIATGDDRICNRCGMQGHIRRQCQLQVAYCTFCNATSHTTGACRARAAFLRDNPVSSSRRTSPNGTNTGSTTNSAQQPRVQQNTNHTSQWSAEPTMNGTQNRVGQVQAEVSIQPANRHGVQNNTTTVEPAGDGVQQAPVYNAEISSYQPQYQENRTRNANTQEVQNTVAQDNPQRNAVGTTRDSQQDISPQFEALQAQINVLQAQLIQQNQRASPYQQPTTVDPLMVVGPWQHTGQQPTGSTQLMGQLPNNQGTTHHIQPTITNSTTGRGSLMLNTSIPPPTMQAHLCNESDSQTSLLQSVREITETMQQHIALSGKQTEYNIGQNALLVKELIKSNDRRDLDHALAAIPTFMGTNKEECIEWLSRIKNVCK